VPTPILAAGPLARAGQISFRLPDPEERLAGVRLGADRGNPLAGAPFAREGGEWALTARAPDLARFEYLLELEPAGGGDSEWVPDPATPLRAPGAFGEKSVVELPGYALPPWLAVDGVDGRREALSVASSALGADVDVELWCPADAGDGEELPLLVAHDGPEYDRLAALTRFAAAQIAAGALPPHRVALLAPGDRNQWYSASALYARTLVRGVLPAIAGAVAVRAPVGLGASLGGLAMLHAHRRHPEAFDGLMLQSASFFMPRHDAHEGGFVRYRRIVRFVRGLAREDAPRVVPVALTCGHLEENVHNNRAVARTLAAAGYPAALHEVRDLHNYTAWRDALDPHLVGLLRAVWS
jgi:enterochelin esterase-like enzyme